ncbi:hypothetical protein [Novosphingobium sp. HR1a]|uniref:hypothetical protein n=1 Tax=Novosphingobium sp. HR1a TaxID=1395637 RepID=UPI001B3C66CA|nr:hypothetical protein [Novosphingobium sp. HR1a]
MNFHTSGYTTQKKHILPTQCAFETQFNAARYFENHCGDRGKRGCHMTSDIDHCEEMIAHEEQLASAAPSSEAAESHRQLAMLYRIQCKVLRNKLTDPSSQRPSIGMAF